MPSSSLVFLHVVGYLAATAALVYGVLVVVAVALWRIRPRVAKPSCTPPVTILKPLCGMEPGLYANLRSFCEQRYPVYQVVFGVRDANDPALAVVRRLQREFPGLDMTIAIENGQHADNLKVENLMSMIGLARYEHLVITDSDILVGRDYLHHVSAPLTDRRVGIVTCLYRARPAGGLWSRLNGLFIDDWFMPSVLVARLFGSRAFVSGATIALRRSTLTAIGGLDAIANYLADDYMLGALTRERGLRTVLSFYVVETAVHEQGFRALVAHEARWLRTLRVLRPRTYPFTFVTCTAPLALIGVVLTAGETPAVVMCGCALALRCALRCLQAERPGALATLWLLPMREALTVYVWFASLANRPIRWRAQQYALGPRGLLRRIVGAPGSRR